MKQHDVIISGRHLELTESIKNMVYHKVEKLFKHEDQIIRLRVELQEDPSDKEVCFTAKGHIEIKGDPLIITDSSNDLYKSIDLMVEKLDRKIRQRSRLEKVKRKKITQVEIPASIPKAVVLG